MRQTPYLVLSIFILCILRPAYTVGQESVTIVDKSWSVSANFAPNIGYRELQGFNQRENIASRNFREKSAFGYSAGIRLHYMLSRKSELAFGIDFSHETLGFQDLSLTTAIGFPGGTVSTKVHYRYIELPLMYRRYFNHSRISIFGNIGLSLKYFLRDGGVITINFLNGEKETTNFDDNLIDPNQLNANFLVGLGLRIAITDRIYTTINPTFKYSLFPVEDADIRQYNYSFGALFNVGYYF